MTESPSLRCCCRVKALAVWPTPSAAPSFLPRCRHLITVGSLYPPSDPATTAKSCVLVHLCFLNHEPVPLPSGPDHHCCFSSTRSRCHGKLDPGEPPPLFLPQIGHLPPPRTLGHVPHYPHRRRLPESVWPPSARHGGGGGEVPCSLVVGRTCWLGFEVGLGRSHRPVVAHMHNARSQFPI
jgi:hypothetical protein